MQLFFKAVNGSVEGEPSFDVMIVNLVVGSHQPIGTLTNELACSLIEVCAL